MGAVDGTWFPSGLFARDPEAAHNVTDYILRESSKARLVTEAHRLRPSRLARLHNKLFRRK